MWEDIQKARRGEHAARHLPQHTTQDPQPADAVCPSESKWPLACPCVHKHPTSRFQPTYGLTLALVPARLINSWTAEWDRVIDVRRRRLGLTLKVIHTNARGPHVLPPQEARELWVDPTVGSKASADLDSTRYFILSTATSWNRVKSTFARTIQFTEPREGLTATGRPRQPKITHRKIEGLRPARQLIDEFHETKSVGTEAMRAFRSHAALNGDCKSVFMSGTPWSQSPRDLQGVLGVLEAAAKADGTVSWNDHPSLKAACHGRFERLMTLYTSLLKNENPGDGDARFRSKVKKATDTFATILEAVMIRRTSQSRWFDDPIIPLPALRHEQREFRFPVRHQAALDRIEEVSKRQHEQEALQWQRRNPGQTFKRSTNYYFRNSYKQRAIATIPGLATLLQDPDTPAHLDLTWRNYCEQGYLQNHDNPYMNNLDMLEAECPKLSYVKAVISWLGSMRWKGEPAEGVEMEVKEVPEKLVVVSTNPVVCAIFAAVRLLSPIGGGGPS